MKRQFVFIKFFVVFYIVFLLGVCWSGNIGQLQEVSVRDRIAARYGKCDVDSNLPMWSWGFARLCCEVYPDKLGMKRNTIFEYGDLSEKHYFLKKGIQNGDAVYVTSPDMPLFLNTFMQLPMTTRIVLVSGAEDIGLPYELFHPHRVNFFDYNMGAIWPNGQLMTMRQFVADPRLSKWIVQNYDFVGCNAYTCSSIKNSTSTSADAADFELTKKIIPMPIGLDLHSFSEKRGFDEHTTNQLLCDQRRELNSLAHAALPFKARRIAAVAGFDCKFDASRIGVGRKRTRGELCHRLAENHRNGLTTDIVMPTSGTSGSDENTARRKKFWSELGSVAFALAPAGFGTDTHRFWEALLMGTVPIVLKSTLDPLYSQYPCIILDSWEDMFKPNALQSYYQQIVARFGEEPFSSEVSYRQSVDYWIKLVQHERKQILSH